MEMDRSKQIALNISHRIKDPGAHMYHAATGVADGHEAGSKKRAKIKKAFARFRGMRGHDQGTHHYANDLMSKNADGERPE
jgi:hypothetical protein